REHVQAARVAALMQMLAPESPSMRLGLVRYLSSVANPEATRALARMAIFSSEEEIRQAAVDALKVRRERDYTEVLTSGLRYPWPAVAKRAADAIVKLERKDLIPQLVDMLEDPDPRNPVAKKEEGEGQKKTFVVREMVKLNHHRSCLMCHSPANPNQPSNEILTPGIPIAGEQLTPPSQGYQNSRGDILVRIDVTYLRQDFSVFQTVPDASPWPESQRFDFLVRERALTEAEAKEWKVAVDKREEGVL